MSYILEALKKAQAERQLGSAPTIHAPAVHAVPAARARRVPLLAGALAAVALLAAGLFVWRMATPVPSAPPAATAVPAMTASVAPPVPAPRERVALLPEPVAPVSANEAPRAKPVPRPAPQRAPAPVPEQARTSAEETTRTFNDLPEALRRDMPKVVFGGYIYSPNPADRLLLVDKVLRKEGEEVAPGLVLEKLLPDAAVMNYRGQRYRAPY